MSYPPPNNQYPPQQGGYPPQQGYPQQGGYPPQQGGYPPQQQYPPQQGGYPPQQGGYPPQPQQTGYPPQQGGYPPQQQYPPQGGFQPTYPPQQGGYPPQQGGYPPQQGGYPPQQTGYPPQQGGYPPQQGGYPPQQTGYPPQQGGYPPQQTGYPPQQGGFPPQQGGYQQFPQQGQPIASYYITAPIMQIPPYNGEPDAEALYKAMKGLGTNDGVLSNIVATRTRDQLQEIKRVFERKYGKTLEHWIKGETSGHYEDLLISLIDEKAEYDAKLIKSAVKGLGTNDGQLIETICTRNNGELRAMKLAYQKLYHVDVEKDVNDDTSGDYRKLLLAILRADRPEAQPVNIEDAKRDAQRLYQAGEGKIGTDEATFVEILSQRSLPQLQTIANCYASITNHSLESGISKETSGNFKKAMIVLITPKDEYFAQSIRTAIEGSGTNDKALIRCLSYISTNKDLMRAVNQFYTHRWKHNLMNDIGGDTSGWYKKTAQAVIGNRVNL